MSVDTHEKLLKENITAVYKKAPTKLEKSINLEAKSITKKLKLADRIEYLPQSSAYITLKDHKENFISNPSCRLTNPSKSELGKISKIIIEQINKKLLDVLEYQQWKNTATVIEWFKRMSNKVQCKFVQMDIKDFYPSLSQTTLDNALLFAQEHIQIADDNLRLIKHCRKSLLFNKGEAWKKKLSDSLFDVTMGSGDAAEIRELVGIYILSNLTIFIGKKDVGLYRDDGLLILRQLNGQQTDRIRKRIIKTFKIFGFKIEIMTNLPEVDFLDATFDIRTNTYRLYRRPNNTPSYIHMSSNHPPEILKRLPTSISKLLSRNSSNKQIFDSVKPEYEEALKKSGYQASLEYIDEKVDNIENNTNKMQRKRKIIWFNPPFDKSVTTNVGRRFLNLVEKHFPKEHKLHMCFWKILLFELNNLLFE